MKKIKMAVFWICLTIAFATALPSELLRIRYSTEGNYVPPELRLDMQKIVTKMPKDIRHQIMGNPQQDNGAYFDVLSKSPDAKPTYIISDRDNKRYRVRIKPKSKEGAIQSYGSKQEFEAASKSVSMNGSGRQSTIDANDFFKQKVKFAPEESYSGKQVHTKERVDNGGYGVKTIKKYKNVAVNPVEYSNKHTDDFTQDNNDVIRLDSDEFEYNNNGGMSSKDELGLDNDRYKSIDRFEKSQYINLHPEKSIVGDSDHKDESDNYGLHIKNINNFLSHKDIKEKIKPKTKKLVINENYNKDQKEIENNVYINKWHEDNDVNQKDRDDNKLGKDQLIILGHGSIDKTKGNDNFDANRHVVENISNSNKKTYYTTHYANKTKVDSDQLLDQDYSVLKKKRINKINENFGDNSDENTDIGNDLNNDLMNASFKHVTEYLANTDDDQNSKPSENIVIYSEHQNNNLNDNSGRSNGSYINIYDSQSDDKDKMLKTKTNYITRYIINNITTILNSTHHVPLHNDHVPLQIEHTASNFALDDNQDVINHSNKNENTIREIDPDKQLKEIDILNFLINNNYQNQGENASDIESNKNHLKTRDATREGNSHESYEVQPDKLVNIPININTEINDTDDEENPSFSSKITVLPDYKEKENIKSSNQLIKDEFVVSTIGRDNNKFIVPNNEQDSVEVEEQKNTEDENVAPVLRQKQINELIYERINNSDDDDGQYIVKSKEKENNKVKWATDLFSKDMNLSLEVPKENGEYKDIIQICKDLKLQPRDIWLLAKKYFDLDIKKSEDLRKFKNLYVRFITNLRNGTESNRLKKVLSILKLLNNDISIDNLDSSEEITTSYPIQLPDVDERMILEYSDENRQPVSVVTHSNQVVEKDINVESPDVSFIHNKADLIKELETVKDKLVHGISSHQNDEVTNKNRFVQLDRNVLKTIKNNVPKVKVSDLAKEPIEKHTLDEIWNLVAKNEEKPKSEERDKNYSEKLSILETRTEDETPKILEVSLPFYEGKNNLHKPDIEKDYLDDILKSNYEHVKSTEDSIERILPPLINKNPESKEKDNNVALLIPTAHSYDGNQNDFDVSPEKTPILEIRSEVDNPTVYDIIQQTLPVQILPTTPTNIAEVPLSIYDDVKDLHKTKILSEYSDDFLPKFKSSEEDSPPEDSYEHSLPTVKGEKPKPGRIGMNEKISVSIASSKKENPINFKFQPNIESIKTSEVPLPVYHGVKPELDRDYSVEILPAVKSSDEDQNLPEDNAKHILSLIEENQYDRYNKETATESAKKLLAYSSRVPEEPTIAEDKRVTLPTTPYENVNDEIIRLLEVSPKNEPIFLREEGSLTFEDSDEYDIHNDRDVVDNLAPKQNKPVEWLQPKDVPKHDLIITNNKYIQHFQGQPEANGDLQDHSNEKEEKNPTSIPLQMYVPIKSATPDESDKLPIPNDSPYNLIFDMKNNTNKISPVILDKTDQPEIDIRSDEEINPEIDTFLISNTNDFGSQHDTELKPYSIDNRDLDYFQYSDIKDYTKSGKISGIPADFLRESIQRHTEENPSKVGSNTAHLKVIRVNKLLKPDDESKTKPYSIGLSEDRSIAIPRTLLLEYLLIKPYLDANRIKLNQQDPIRSYEDDWSSIGPGKKDDLNKLVKQIILLIVTSESPAVKAKATELLFRVADDNQLDIEPLVVPVNNPDLQKLKRYYNLVLRLVGIGLEDDKPVTKTSDQTNYESKHKVHTFHDLTRNKKIKPENNAEEKPNKLQLLARELSTQKGKQVGQPISENNIQMPVVNSSDIKQQPRLELNDNKKTNEEKLKLNIEEIIKSLQKKVRDEDIKKYVGLLLLHLKKYDQQSPNVTKTDLSKDYLLKLVEKLAQMSTDDSNIVVEELLPKLSNVQSEYLMNILPQKQKEQIKKYIILHSYSPSNVDQSDIDKIYLLANGKLKNQNNNNIKPLIEMVPNGNNQNAEDPKIGSFIEELSKIREKYNKEPRNNNNKLILGIHEIVDEPYNLPASHQKNIKASDLISKLLHSQIADSTKNHHFKVIADALEKGQLVPHENLLETPKKYPFERQIVSLLPGNWQKLRNNLNFESILAINKPNTNLIYSQVAGDILREALMKVNQYLLLYRVPVDVIRHINVQIQRDMYMNSRDGKCLEGDLDAFIDKLKRSIQANVLSITNSRRGVYDSN